MRVVAFAFALFVMLASLARAQAVRWAAAEAGMPNAVALVFENCEPDGQPELPVVAGATFTFLGRSESSQSTLGPGGFSTTRSVAMTYMVRGRPGAAVAIPAFTVKTNKGPQRVDAYSVAAPGAPLESVASAKLVPEKTTVWAGEVFGLNYELSASRRTNPQISPTFDWNPAPLVSEDWSKPEVTEAFSGGDRRLHVVFKTRAVAKTANTLKLEAASHLLSIQTGTIGFGIISQPRMEQVSVTSDQPTLQVRPLPPPPPAGFGGAVGQFKLTSKVVPEKAAVGEPVTWTLELSGTGNWPDIAGLPARDVSNDFQVVQPKAKRTPAEARLFDVALAEDVVLVPTKPGSYALGPIRFTYFDPQAGAYKTEIARGTTVTIVAPNTPQFNITTQPEAGAPKSEAGASGPPDTGARKPIVAATPPAGIPRDPLPGSASAVVPMRIPTLVGWLVAPVAGVLAFWGWLAVRRARETDPVRPRREARDRMAKTLAHLQTAPEAERAGLLLGWQHDAAVLWQIRHAAPRPTAFADPAWSTLWAEADRALYGARTALPADWVARAQEALVAKPVPGFQPLRLFLPQNLMPFAALLTVLAVVGLGVLQAAELDGAAAYRKGDFIAAEKAWREKIAAQPTNWIARHNLSLAMAQQERVGEAAAHAVAAFIQQPAHPATRWHFGYAAEKSGALPLALSRFVVPGPMHSIGRLASPAVWQRLLIAAAWLMGLAVAWLLANAYRQRRDRVRWAALALTIVGATLGAGAAVGAKSYGPAADPAAVMVARGGVLRSIPTEADTTQKTTPLAVGTLATAGRTFLGWTQIAFENGQTGWVRSGDVVALWR